MPQPRDLFRLSVPRLSVSTTPFVSEGNTSSGAFSRGSSALSQAGRRARPYLASLLISDSFFRFWCLRPLLSQGPDCLPNPALPQFMGLSCTGSEPLPQSHGGLQYPSRRLHCPHPGAFPSHPRAVNERALLC